jgi:hypothetical protein
MEGKMPLVKVQVRKNIHPRQIEFGDGVERSKPGALYFVPGAIKTITSDEYNWIEKHDKNFFKFLIVLSSDIRRSRLERKNVDGINSTVSSKNKISKTKRKDKNVYLPNAVEKNSSKTDDGGKSIPDKKGNE